MSPRDRRVIPPHRNVYLVPLSIVIAGMMTAGAILYTNRSGGSERASDSGQATKGKNDPKAVNAAGTESADRRVSVSTDDDPVLGNLNAPVTIIEFADYKCGYCRKFFTETLPALREKYINTGKVKLVYRDQPILGQQSQWAAEASECANEQGKFWEFHEYLFRHSSGSDMIPFERDKLKEMAQDLKLNVKRFNACFDSNKYSREVQKDLLDGKEAGVTGTPAFVINGRFIKGAKPTAFFERVVEEELAAKGINR